MLNSLEYLFYKFSSFYLTKVYEYVIIYSMPNGDIHYLFHDIYRKLSLAKILTKKKGKELIDSAIEDIEKVEKYAKSRKK